MRFSRLAAVFATLAPAVLSAQAMSTSMSTRPETTFVKGTVTGEVPTGTNYTITSTTSSYYTIPAPSMTPSTTDMSSTSSMSTPVEATVTTPAPAPKKKTLDRKIAHGASEAAGDVSKLGKKAAHGVKEAASDVKKKVTGKP